MLYGRKYWRPSTICGKQAVEQILGGMVYVKVLFHKWFTVYYSVICYIILVSRILHNTENVLRDQSQQ